MQERLRIALITGIGGQDGSYLSEFLLDRDYEVHGITLLDSDSLPLDDRIIVHHADISDAPNLQNVIDEIAPTEVYNLAAKSRVSLSFAEPVQTGTVNGLGAVRLLENVRQYQYRAGRLVRFYQASSSEMFGQAIESPQNEKTPFHPRSPYACAKAYAHWQTVNYREAYGMFACNGILFNHESPRRRDAFVTRKITRAATRIKVGLAHDLTLGDVDIRRDWGFAGDYVEAMWLTLQQDHPDDYVVATGESHSLRDFLDEVFGYLDLDWRDYVRIDPQLYRPAEVAALRGDATKARRRLNWQPRSTFRELARMMTIADLALAESELAEQAADQPKCARSLGRHNPSPTTSM